MPVSYTLDADAMQRTADAVRFVEAMPRDNRGPQRRRRNNTGRVKDASAGIAVLLTDLNYGSTAQAQLYNGQTLEPETGEITVNPWKLQPGESVEAGTEIDVHQIDGVWYLRNSACAPQQQSSGG